ncbi:holliday junction DNA helicase RuvA [Novimethylophilus kurashikiensis]|uniref:Holliday junction branch migration complex subunit RuvA n=1 Tax=Novimethylophilus kurashikiensis TaxID=1825523 RepID=A0A2R5F777_9PROT|nr:Holliday junction branch migration protein RuvA [Novimethylophilus kurashikiensis]GBG13905.1 holliday junction DNA helicase RuvA [Novimethylophilus kurashikiensis]
MIGRLTGVLLEKNPPQILIDVHGIGYEVEVPMSTFYNLPQTGERVVLHTQFVVREDAQLLYGFATDRERQTFRQLLKVNGIGAKSALGILSGLSVDDLAQAIALQEPALLVKIPGIGKKTAERLLLELKDKLGFESASAQPVTGGGGSGINDVLNALLALGYNERESLAAVKQLPNGLSVSDGIRQALKALSKT